MKKIIIVVTLFITFIVSDMKAQVNQEWVATFNGLGGGGNYAVKNAIDKFGNLIVAGRSDSASEDYIVLKYSNSGNLIWQKRYTGPGISADRIRDLVLDDSGNIYVTGVTNEGSAFGGQNWLTIKYNTDGILQWKKSLNWTGNRSDVPNSITIDQDYNVLVTGFGFLGPDPFLREELIVIKYSPTGEIVWTRSHISHVFYSDIGYSVVTDNSNSVYVSGYSVDSILTIKYDSKGNTVWERTFFRNTDETSPPLFSKIDKNNNIIVTGFYSLTLQYNFVTLKYDSDGHLLWSRVFDSPIGALDVAHGMCLDGNSNIYITGRTFTNFYNDVMLLKYGSNGDTLWLKTWDGGFNANDEAFDLCLDTSGNAYVTGSSYSPSLDDFITLKFDSLGNLKWEKRYMPISNPPGSDFSKNICLDKDNNVFITGSAEIRPIGYSIISIKYSQLTNITNGNFRLTHNYYINNSPNPFNPSTIIKYEIPVAGLVTIEVYNLSGRKVQSLVNDNKLPGTHEIVFNGYSLASGIYFYSLIVNKELKISNKFILIK